MKVILLFTLLIVLEFNEVNAQDDTLALKRGTTYPGYIITLENDTIHGWVLNINLWLNQHQTFFYDDPDNPKDRVKYTAKELKGYRAGNREYESIKFLGTYSTHAYNFYMRQVTGPFNYYVWYYDPERSNLASDITLQGISDAILFEENELASEGLGRKLDGDMVNFNHLKYMTNFDKNMSKLVEDFPELAEKIRNKEEGYKWINVKKIITEYDEWYSMNH